jgi:hypothetical protein
VWIVLGRVDVSDHVGIGKTEVHAGHQCLLLLEFDPQGVGC